MSASGSYLLKAEEIAEMVVPWESFKRKMIYEKCSMKEKDRWRGEARGKFGEKQRLSIARTGVK